MFFFPNSSGNGVRGGMQSSLVVRKYLTGKRNLLSRRPVKISTISTSPTTTKLTNFVLKLTLMLINSSPAVRIQLPVVRVGIVLRNSSMSLARVSRVALADPVRNVSVSCYST